MSRDPACASCGGPVREGRCPVCRVARTQLHPNPLPLWLILALLTLAAVTSLVLSLRPA